MASAVTAALAELRCWLRAGLLGAGAPMGDSGRSGATSAAVA